MLHHQTNSISCTALNSADETSQLLSNSLQHQKMLQQYQQQQYSGPSPSVLQSMPSSSYHYQGSTQPVTYHGQQQQQLTNELNLSFNLIENDIKEIRDYLRHTRKKLETTDAKSKQTNDWKQVALVLDRTLFFIYLIINCVSLTLMFHNIWISSNLFYTLKLHF